MLQILKKTDFKSNTKHTPKYVRKILFVLNSFWNTLNTALFKVAGIQYSLLREFDSCSLGKTIYLQILCGYSIFMEVFDFAAHHIKLHCTWKSVAYYHRCSQRIETIPMDVSPNRHHQHMQSLWSSKQQSMFYMSREKPDPQENRVINPDYKIYDKLWYHEEAQIQNFWLSSRYLNILIQVVPKSHPIRLFSKQLVINLVFVI